MTDCNFTPGPWYVGDQDGYLWNIHDGKARTIAETGMGNDIYADHAEANAHLIATAPELYEALDELEAFVHNLGYREYPSAAKARAALAKARGNP